MLDMTQGLFGKILLRPEPTFRYPEISAQVASIGFSTFRDLMDPRIRRERVGVRL